MTFWALNSKLLVIKVVYDEVDSGQSLKKSDLLLHEQVSTLSLENLVWLFLNHDDDISWLSAWDGVRLTMEDVLFSIGATLVDLDFENLLLLLDLIPSRPSRPTTLVAWLSRLRIHARSNLHHPGYSTLSLAVSAHRILALSVTLNSVTIDCNFGCFALVDVVECHFNGVLDGLALLWASLSLTTAAEHG